MTIELEKTNCDRLEIAATLTNALVEEIEGVTSIHADGPFVFFIFMEDIEEEFHDEDKDYYKLNDGSEITIRYV